MDKRQLTAFLCVFEERNITRAAAELSLTQPALSATIKALEEELGTQLFVRKPRGVEVTEDARVLYPHARRMMGEMSALTARFRKKHDKFPLSLGIEQNIASSQLITLLERINHNLPDVLLTLTPGCSGDIRLGCEGQLCEDELFIPLFDERYVLAFPLNHPMSQITELTAKQLNDQPWVMSPEHESHQRFLPLYGTSGNFPRANAGSFTLALNLVAAGVGLTIAPVSLVEEQCNVAFRSLPGYPLMRRTGICYAMHTQLNPIIEQLLANVSE